MLFDYVRRGLEPPFVQQAAFDECLYTVDVMRNVATRSTQLSSPPPMRKNSLPVRTSCIVYFCKWLLCYSSPLSKIGNVPFLPQAMPLSSPRPLCNGTHKKEEKQRSSHDKEESSLVTAKTTADDGK